MNFKLWQKWLLGGLGCTLMWALGWNSDQLVLVGLGAFGMGYCYTSALLHYLYD